MKSRNGTARYWLFLIILSHLQPVAARAGVLQLVTVGQTLDGVGVTRVSDEVFGVTSADITGNILAQIGAFPALGFRAVSSASQFGSVGLSGSVFPRGVEVGSFVHVASDEFVNLTGVPQRATANFVIDGGSLFIEAGRNVRATYDLSLTAWNLGVAPIEADRSDFDFIVFRAPGFPFGSREFATSGILEADGSGSLSFVSSGRDIGAVFDPMIGRVEIPLSFQSLDLGTLGPGERQYLEYNLSLTAGGLGGSEGTFVRFSDPFNLSGNSVLGTISLQPVSPVPEPSTLLLFAGGIVGVIASSRRRGNGPLRPLRYSP